MELEPDEHLAPMEVAINNEIINPNPILGINPEPPDVDKQRREIIAQVVNKHLSVRDAATQLHVTQTQIRRQRHKFETGQRICGKPGAPRKLDFVAERKLVQTVKSRARESKALLKGDMSTLFEELIDETAVRSGVGNAPLSMARSTKKSYLDANKIGCRKCQTTTGARQREERDFRNYISTAVMLNVAGVPELPPERVFNFDATYLTAGKKNDKVMYVIGDPMHYPVAHARQLENPVSLHYLLLSNANGERAPDTFVIKHPGLTANQIIIKEIPRMVNGNVGYLIFCSRKGGAYHMIRQYFTDIAIPWINKIATESLACRAADSTLKRGKSRESQSTGNQDNTRGRSRESQATPNPPRNEQTNSVLIMDGDLPQVTAIMEATMQNLLRANSIAIGKLAASCSGTTQPNDVGTCFKCAKAMLRILDETKTHDDDILKVRLLGVLKEVKYPPSKCNRYAEELLKFSYAASSAVTPDRVRTGFSNSGVFPCDPQRLYRQCRADVTPEIIALLDNPANFEVLCQQFEETGRLAEAAMTDLGVPEWVQRRPTQLAKDKKVAIHERALLLTHSCVVERHMHYLTTSAEKRARTKARSAGANSSSSAALTSTATADQGAEREMAQAKALLVNMRLQTDVLDDDDMRALNDHDGGDADDDDNDDDDDAAEESDEYDEFMQAV
jgi:hypothetical protein